MRHDPAQTVAAIRAREDAAEAECLASLRDHAVALWPESATKARFQLSPPDAAKLLDVGVDTIRDAMASERLPSITFNGRKRYVTLQMLARWYVASGGWRTREQLALDVPQT